MRLCLEYLVAQDWKGDRAYAHKSQNTGHVTLFVLLLCLFLQLLLPSLETGGEAGATGKGKDQDKKAKEKRKQVCDNCLSV